MAGHQLALVGTRGPGHYGGFETCVAEIAPRLADRGHGVRVYARRWSPARDWQQPGVEVVTQPSLRTKHLDTISHTVACAAHLQRRPVDVVVCFGVGNAPVAWGLRRRGTPVVLNVDGLDRARAKWGRGASAYLHWAERIAPASCDVLVTDAHTIQRYYRDEHGTESTFIPYGAPSGPVADTDVVESFGLEPGGYVLYVSRLEPENNAHVLVDAYRRVETDLPLVVVGGATYGDAYERSLHERADDRVRFLGFVFGKGYEQLQSHAGVYVQCTEVGGTHPALVEAMGYGNAVIALDTPEHREVLGDSGRYYSTVDELASSLAEMVDHSDERTALSERARIRAADEYSWEAVTDAYVEACHRAIELRN